MERGAGAPTGGGSGTPEGNTEQARQARRVTPQVLVRSNRLARPGRVGVWVTEGVNGKSKKTVEFLEGLNIVF